MLSCSGSNDETVDETQDLQPDKAYAFYVDTPYSGNTFVNNFHYQFTYENGDLKTFSLPTATFTLLYQNNQVKIVQGNYYVLHTIKNNRPIKSEFYDYSSVLFKTKLYSYSKGTVAVHEKEGNKDAYMTFYFNSDNNLIKQEMVVQKDGLNLGMYTSIYSDYDKAKNPFVKLGLVNDILFIKSLSTNNFRKIETSYESFTNQDIPTKIYNCVYKYDSNGQVLLYHPL
ncbi:hypothetical protein EG347_18130 [Chryseobacterium sp. G0186]|nr:hypothetical protein EG347_18130 [Chryseobacterium sp. G0186]